MMTANRVLLASHGTRGALAAERVALGLCGQGGVLYHLLVVPKALWQGMTGDDWLNNGSTRDTFRRYLESELGREVAEYRHRVEASARERGLDYYAEVMLGEPERCLIDYSRQMAADLVVMGSPRPKGKAGLRSRMKPETLVRALAVPLLIVPYPVDE